MSSRGLTSCARAHSPGGYKYGDDLRFGIPLGLITWLIVTLGHWLQFCL